MKTKLLLMTGLVILFTNLKGQTFQESFEFFGNNFHSVCTDQLSDASNDIVVAGMADSALDGSDVGAPVSG